MPRGLWSVLDEVILDAAAPLGTCKVAIKVNVNIVINMPCAMCDQTPWGHGFTPSLVCGGRIMFLDFINPDLSSIERIKASV